jgi:hypothetical protein
MDTYKDILKGNFPELSDMQNKCIMELTFYPEDADTPIKLPIGGYGKILAIAIYDWYIGSTKENDVISIHLSSDAFRQLFSHDILDLF